MSHTARSEGSYTDNSTVVPTTLAQISGAKALQFAEILVAPLALDHLLVRTLLALFVEVFDLTEASPRVEELLEGRRKLTYAVPAAWRIANTILRIGNPVLALLRHVEHLPDPNFAPRGVVHFFEELGIGLDPWSSAALVQVVNKRLSHHWRWLALVVVDEGELRAEWVVVSAMVWECRVADACEMRRDAKVIIHTSSHDQHVVSQVAQDTVRILLRTRQQAA